MEQSGDIRWVGEWGIGPIITWIVIALVSLIEIPSADINLGNKAMLPLATTSFRYFL